MFDSKGAFTRQFTQAEGGYIYYPSAKSGGKLVTAEEYRKLAQGWSMVSTGKVAGILFLAVIAWTALSQTFSLPDGLETVFIASCVTCVALWVLWVAFAPRRLVRDRPAITPPRPASQARRQVRALLTWQSVIFALLFGGVMFLGSLRVSEPDVETWAWRIGGGALFGLYLWIGFQKLRDR
ncbi:hypothetical protein FHS95_002773 [Sphingomonas naasensis]|uniref:Uncharacterized protein n=1 Tax=Sphingomonas naasensis TaxID=1344951 RepID=A0A4S1WL36_9SPHN|nr:hypothetical protein [Sphingomonas naasensis]NIJ21081.1 hypothetical protein [Sphingomonas naasensis]TGX43453.1 hypothetical protein E5A74_09890 [Sphingomonas naasensis]